MNINERLNLHIFHHGDTTLLCHESYCMIESFIIPKIVTEKYNWTCKACGKKIKDPIQVITYESHNPSYHYKCHEYIAQRMITDLLQTREIAINPIREILDELEPLDENLISHNQTETQ